MSANLMQILFCNCCATGCDCGCVEDCRLVNHRPTSPGGSAATTEGETHA